MSKYDSFDEIQKAMSWLTISTPYFKRMLYYNPYTGEYKAEGKEVDESDERLIAFKEAYKNSKPVDLI